MYFGLKNAPITIDEFQTNKGAMSKRGISVSALLACFAATAAVHQDALLDMIPRHARGGNLWKKRLAAAEASEIKTNGTALIFQQLVDHSGASTATFAQRYYVDHSYCVDMTSCPIFMYIGGGTFTVLTQMNP